MGVGEAKDDKKLKELMIPSIWCLLKTIDRFMKFAHKIEIITINES